MGDQSRSVCLVRWFVGLANIQSCLSLVRDARLYAVVSDLLDAGLRPVPIFTAGCVYKGIKKEFCLVEVEFPVW